MNLRESSAVYFGTLATFGSEVFRGAPLITNAVGILTAFYTLLKIISWFRNQKKKK